MSRITRSVSRASRNSCDNVSIGSPKQLLDPDAISLASSNAENFYMDVGSQSSSPATGPILPDSDQSYHRRIFIMPTASNSGVIHSLPHPRSGNATLYLFDHNNAPLELMRLDQTRRSLFYGDSVIADPGQMLLFLPVHPFFLALPHLHAKASEHFMALEDVLQNEQFPALRLLARNDKLLETLKLAADYEYEGATMKIRLNNDRLYEWLKMKFAALKKSVLGNVDGVDNNLEQHTLGIIADYLPETIGEQLRLVLGINEEEKETKPMANQTNRKRLAVDPLNGFNSPKAIPATKKRMSRVLAVASKGTQSLKSFFTTNKDEQQNKDELKKEEGNQGQD